MKMLPDPKFCKQHKNGSLDFFFGIFTILNLETLSLASLENIYIEISRDCLESRWNKLLLQQQKSKHRNLLVFGF